MKVSEIFRSIQGEGRGQGKICTFIRLAGCNLRCAWCDTQYTWEGGIEMEQREILSEISRLGSRMICITGGEPLLQKDELLSLVRKLCREGYEIGIETNGTLDFTGFQPYAAICMDVKCPSSGEGSDLLLLAHISRKDDVKFVVNGVADLRYVEAVLADHDIPGEVIVTPVSGSDPGMIAGYILERGLPVRFQVQLHKVIGVR
jgi:7-carboxy-7-deazaguanine synthase